MLLSGNEVLDVRDHALVELLRPLVGDVLAEEAVVVGGDDDVAVDSLALREPTFDLREVPRVVVDLLVVVHLDAGLLGELLERRRLVDARGFECLRRVDVVRPVREVHNLVHLVAARRTLRRAAAARRQQPRNGQRTDSDGTAPQQIFTGHPRAHSFPSFACSITKVDSGLQLNVTSDPGDGTRAPASMFCAKT